MLSQNRRKSILEKVAEPYRYSAPNSAWAQAQIEGRDFSPIRQHTGSNVTTKGMNLKIVYDEANGKYNPFSSTRPGEYEGVRNALYNLSNEPTRPQVPLSVQRGARDIKSPIGLANYAVQQALPPAQQVAKSY